MGAQRLVSPRRAARERAPPPTCAPQPAVRGGGLKHCQQPAGASMGTVLGEGRGSGCPATVWGRLPAPGPRWNASPKGAILDNVPRRLLGPRTQSTAWHVGAPRDASDPGPSRCPSLAHLFHYHQPPLLPPCPISSPWGPSPPDVNTQELPPLKQQVGGLGVVGLGVVGCRSLAVLCLPDWQEVWEGGR